MSTGFQSAGLIDPDDPTVVDFAARQATAIVPFNLVQGRPVNPVRNTGRAGRGELWLWAENQAADPIVVADGDSHVPHVLLIQRGDCDQWAIPGGMVDPGEYAKDTLVRELREETGVDLRHIPPVVLAGLYVNDPRNTDEAWICSTVALFRVRAQVTVTAGDDAVAAGWFPFVSVPALAEAVRRRTGQVLYPPHRPLLQLALDHGI